MTKNKRFTIFGEWHKDNVIDEIRDNTGEYVTIGRVVDLLNANEQLKQKNDNLIKISAMTQVRNDRLKEENEQLKSDLKELHEICAYYEHRIKELKDSDVE